MAEKEITYRQVADYFLALANECGELITSLKLQKLVYYAQAWHITVLKKPLFQGNFQAWVHGPVLPALYADYREQYWHPIVNNQLGQKDVDAFIARLNPEQVKLLEDVTETYFGMSAFDLEHLTHTEDPWLKARNGIPKDKPSTEIIQEAWMAEYYIRFWTGPNA